MVEKHITLNRDGIGPDHKASLEPTEFKKMCESIELAWKSIEYRGGLTRKTTQIEKLNKVNLMKTIYVRDDIEKGKRLKGEMFEIKSPGGGISPMLLPG